MGSPTENTFMETAPTHTQIHDNASDPELSSRVIESIREVYDPEIPVNVYDLGLIYEVLLREDNSVHVKMTLTAPNCPAAGILPQQVQSAVAYTEGVTDSTIELTFDPPFTMEMMSDEAKLELGFM